MGLGTEKKTVMIVGAGFSKHLGYPDNSDLQKRMLCLEPRLLSTECALLETAIDRVLEGFVANVFSKEAQPDLDDLLTCIEMSIDSATPLVPWYSVEQLELLRDIIILRFFRVISFQQNWRMQQCEEGVNLLLPTARNIDAEKFLKAHGLCEVIGGERVLSFVSTNWDIALTQCICIRCGVNNPDTIVDPAAFRIRNASTLEPPVLICNMHGSESWLYCPDCDECTGNPGGDATRTALQFKIGQKVELFREQLFDMDLVQLKDTLPRIDWKTDCCSRRQGDALLATHSYLKDQRKKPFRKTWNTAEKQLKEAERWVFSGYSLPAADYSLRHLLKRCQHCGPKKSISVIVRDCDSAERYKKFFGPESIDELCTEGISGYVKMFLN